MARALTTRVSRIGRFIWSSWAGASGLFLFAALWQAGHEAYGSFILPPPVATLKAAVLLLTDPGVWDKATLTSVRALQGFAIAAATGTIAGIIAGYSAATLRVLRPIITVFLGVPPIAWIVIAMIWFGTTGGTVVITIVLASFPLTLISAAEGVMTRDRGLDDMARVYGANAWDRFRTLGARQIVAFLFPSFIIGLGSAFKVAVMAELLANAGGIGGALARARANLDVTEALAWVLISVTALIVFEYCLVHPLRAELERWREAAKPWGIKR